MKYILKTTKHFVLLTISLCILCTTLHSENLKVATLQNKPIYESDIIKEFKNVIDNTADIKDKSFAEFDVKIQEMLIKKYATLKLLNELVIKEKVKDSQKFKEELKLLEKQLAIQFVLSKAANSYDITENELQKAYKDFVEEYNKPVIEVSHILVDSEKQAKDIKSQIEKGMAFEEAAKKYSQDKSSSKKSGYLGKFTKGQLDKSFEETVQSMKTGQISQPTKTKFGWHVIKVISIETPTVPTFKEVKPLLERDLLIKNQTLYIDNLLEKSGFKIIQ